MRTPLPKLIEPGQLQALLHDPELLLIQITSAESYAAAHIPGALFLDPNRLLSGRAPAVGHLPEAEQLDKIFSALGLTPNKHVVACDDEGGGWSGRLLWTLDVIGHQNWSYLNGGIHAWRHAGLPFTCEPSRPTPSAYTAKIHRGPIAEIEDILPRIGAPDFTIWDARSIDEYTGNAVRALRGGHIPGAVHLEWSNLIQRTDPSQRLLPEQELRRRLDTLQIDKEHEIVTYCHTHHRSGLSYLAGRLLDLKIRGYHGSWSEWGNRSDTPVEQGLPQRI